MSHFDALGRQVFLYLSIIFFLEICRLLIFWISSIDFQSYQLFSTDLLLRNPLDVLKFLSTGGSQPGESSLFHLFQDSNVLVTPSAVNER